MVSIPTVVIGGGQAGLAMSHSLSELGIEHIVFERGEVGERWRSQSWDSLRLLTPNWMTRLPGFRYDGDDPNGFMSAIELVGMLEQYAVSSNVPLSKHTTVLSVERVSDRFRIVTDRGDWCADSVVIATGYCDRPAVPPASRRVARSVTQIVPPEYRRPGQLPPGGVLIVGASSTGVQLADEIQRSGRQVTLAVGRHTRLPRRYRGQDILWWLDRLGLLNQPIGDVQAAEISRHQPSLQLVGRPDHATLDLAVLREAGVRMVGRVLDIDGHHVALAEDLLATAAAADIKMAEVLTRIDQFIASNRLSARAAAPFRPTWPLATNTPDRLDLRAEGIRTVVWATGYRRTYPWLHLPVFDARGDIVHDGGVTPVAGLYVLGMNFQCRRNSGFIDGVGADARELARHMMALESSSCLSASVSAPRVR